jgi:hypothetical protein
VRSVDCTTADAPSPSPRARLELDLQRFSAFDTDVWVRDWSSWVLAVRRWAEPSVRRFFAARVLFCCVPFSSGWLANPPPPLSLLSGRSGRAETLPVGLGVLPPSESRCRLRSVLAPFRREVSALLLGRQEHEPVMGSAAGRVNVPPASYTPLRADDAARLLAPAIAPQGHASTPGEVHLVVRQWHPAPQWRLGCRPCRLRRGMRREVREQCRRERLYREVVPCQRAARSVRE